MHGSSSASTYPVICVTLPSCGESKETKVIKGDSGKREGGVWEGKCDEEREKFDRVKEEGNHGRGNANHGLVKSCIWMTEEKCEYETELSNKG